MNAVWNSYGQLCGCPEIFKKSCKFFCRELDIRVTKVMYRGFFKSMFSLKISEPFIQIMWVLRTASDRYSDITTFLIFLPHLFFQIALKVS